MRLLSLLILAGLHLQAIEMSDYRIIFGHYDEAYINGSLKATTGNQDQTAYDLLVNANTRTIYTTALYSVDFKAKGDIGFARGEDSNSSQTKRYDLASSLRYDKYLAYDNMFLYGGGDLGYRKQEQSEKADNLFAKVSLGLGYGRVYNATPLAIALRVVEELKEYKVIYRDLSDVYLLKLAKVIGIKDTYLSKYGAENYKKYWFADMETIFKNAEVSYQEHLGAVGILKMDEVISLEKISGRLHGWKVRGGVGEILSNYEGNAGSKNTTADIEFSYGLPMGYESQYIENALLSKNLYASKPIDFSFENIMSYTYEVTDLLDVESLWGLNYEKYHHGDNVLKNKLSLGLRYYLENSLTLDTTISMTKRDGSNGGVLASKDWDGDFFVGVRYRLK